MKIKSMRFKKHYIVDIDGETRIGTRTPELDKAIAALDAKVIFKLTTEV